MHLKPKEFLKAKDPLTRLLGIKLVNHNNIMQLNIIFSVLVKRSIRPGLLKSS